MNAKKKNPLYVISEDDSVVQEAFGYWDLLIKKLGLEPLMIMVREFFITMLSQVNNYQMFVIVKSVIDSWIEKLINIFKMVRV
jgi:hypothetical protein